MKKISIALLLIGLVVWGYSYFHLNDRNRYAINSEEGSIKEGAIFGIKVGIPYPEASKIMRDDGFKFARQTDDGYLYLESLWRRGTVVLVVENEKVVAIRWSYQLGAP